MANTTYFGWETPDDTDLVKDGAAAIRTLGQAIDTSMQDLEGGTTGQILSKTSNTDMDFTWITNDVGDITAVSAGTGITGGGTTGAITITNDMATTITAAGDIVVGTGSGTYDNLPIGTTNQVLTADTTVSPYKVKWATPAGGGGKVLQVVEGTYSTQTDNSTTTYQDTNCTATITPSAATSKILVIAKHVGYKSAGNSGSALYIQLLRDATKIDETVTQYTASSLDNYGEITLLKLDSPSTTSATTYKTQFKNGTAATQVSVQVASMPSVIILMEIGA